MKRVLAAAFAVVTLASAVPASAVTTNFILSGNAANQPYYSNFGLTFTDGVTSSASISQQVGLDPDFMTNFFFAPGVASIGSGYATANVLNGLKFDNTDGVTLTAYALNAPAQGALVAAFGAPDALTYQAALATLLANLGPELSTISGSTLANGTLATLDATALSEANFYRITLNGVGGAAASRFDGNVTLTAVPEPATWAMMLAGFGLIGFAMRRQRQSHPKVRFAF